MAGKMDLKIGEKYKDLESEALDHRSRKEKKYHRQQLRPKLVAENNFKIP